MGWTARIRAEEVMASDNHNTWKCSRSQHSVVMGNGVPALKAYGGMKPARTTRTVWLWRSNNCIAEAALAFETSRASALVCVLAAPSLRAEYVVLRSASA